MLMPSLKETASSRYRYILKIPGDNNSMKLTPTDKEIFAEEQLCGYCSTIYIEYISISQSTSKERLAKSCIQRHEQKKQIRRVFTKLCRDPTYILIKKFKRAERFMLEKEFFLIEAQ